MFRDPSVQAFSFLFDPFVPVFCDIFGFDRGEVASTHNRFPSLDVELLDHVALLSGGNFLFVIAQGFDLRLEDFNLLGVSLSLNLILPIDTFRFFVRG